MKPMNANELLAGLALARPVPITAVVTDSRKVQPGCIFVCFPGERVDGHDYAALAESFAAAAACKGKPTVLLARTVKGKGVSFMEGDYGWHGKAPNAEQYEKARAELSARVAELEGK